MIIILIVSFLKLCNSLFVKGENAVQFKEKCKVCICVCAYAHKCEYIVDNMVGQYQIWNLQSEF